MINKELKDKILKKSQVPLFSFLISVLLVIFAVLAADLLYAPKKMLKRGYQIEISSDGKIVKKEEKPIDIATLMKGANIESGAKIFKKCATCHNVQAGAANKVGPNLYGVVGRQKAVVSGFSYSESMKAKGGSWNRDDLNQFLTKPKGFVSGTKMGFPGLKKPQDRADVILFLESNR